MLLFRTLLEVVFPSECVVCGVEDIVWCDKCQDKIVYLSEDRCLLCNDNIAQLGVCSGCQEVSGLSGLVVVGKYTDTVLEDVIHELKFNFIEELAKPLANLLALNNNDFWQKLEEFILVPVPLHKKRFLLRGFNQSELIAKNLADVLNQKVQSKVVRRVKETKQQAKLDRHERFSNISGAFSVVSNLEVGDKNVVLVDDVLTSGATMSEVARLLQQNGARNIYGAVIAHG